jgi:hypothetical protein
MVPKRTQIQILNVKALHKKANDLATRIEITTQDVTSGSSCSTSGTFRITGKLKE